MYGDALTTKERMKARLTLSGTGFDSLLDQLILGATARIQQMTGRRFIQGTYTNELHDGTDISGTYRQYLIMKNGPVQSVSSVQYNAGSNSSPSWTDIDEDYYDIDLSTGVIAFKGFMPAGKQNVRVTYTGGFSGYSIGLNNFWIFNATPTGAVNGSNLSFTLPEEADQVIVYVDGVREVAANVTHTNGTTSFTLAAGRAPYSTIAVDYVRSIATTDGDYYLPEDLVDVCERAVVFLFKARENEGKKSEGFDTSSITWRDDIFTAEMRATIKNYRRGYNL
jgi:hypothetical protein